MKIKTFIEISIKVAFVCQLLVRCDCDNLNMPTRSKNDQYSNLKNIYLNLIVTTKLVINHKIK